MNDKRTVALILFLGGLAVLILSLAADAIGIGREPGFGWIQTIGALLGLAVVVVGAVLWRATSLRNGSG